MKSKRIAIEVRGFAAVASVTFGPLIARVEVVANGVTAISTCKPNHWRAKAAELVMRIHRLYGAPAKLDRYWNTL